MKKLKRALIILFSIFGLLFLIGFLYLQSFKPKLKGVVKLQNIENEVKVYYDNYGIPHIYAQNAKDAYRAFGYVHAADRLFQLEMMRRVGAGRLAELFGKDLVKTDMFFKTLGTHRKAKLDADKFDELPQEAKEIITAYIGGINDYIQTGKLPIEYTLLGAKPMEYTVEDLYCIVGYMAFSFSFALRTDPLVEKINREWGYEYLKDFDMAYPPDSLWLPYERKSATYTGGGDTTRDYSLSYLDNLPVPVLQGSNSWVIGPKNTASGKVIFANDTHIKFASPAVWFEAHIEYPGHEVYGNYLAGIPLALVGHTRQHAWGLTMFEDDDSDFFTEKFSSPDSSLTFRGNIQSPVIKHRETIAVKGEKDTTFTVYETRNGPIINSFLPVEFEEPVSMYWNFTSVENNLLHGFYQINYADEMTEFKAGASKIGSPGLNVAYGDASGNIGLWAASKLIVRPENAYGKLFLDATDSLHGKYLGYYPFSENPQYENPEKGYIHSANNYHRSDSNLNYPGYYAADTRFLRIGELLEQSFPATTNSVKEIVLDTYSSTAHDISQEIVRVVNPNNLTDFEAEIWEVLKSWDGRHNPEQTGPAVFYKVLYNSIYDMLADEMGDEVFHTFLNTHLYARSYPKLLFNQNSKWWDDINRPETIQTREEILTEAFKKSAMQLQDELGTDFQKWQWKNIHFAVHEHPMGEVEALKNIFNVGPLPAPGGYETVNNISFLLDQKSEYISHYGPAMRIIIDFSDVENAVSILPTGNSGNPFSKHYHDQSEMYVNGEFRKMMMNKDEIVKVSTLLELKPE